MDTGVYQATAVATAFTEGIHHLGITTAAANTTVGIALTAA